MKEIFKTEQTELNIEEPFEDYFVFNFHTYDVFAEKNVEIDFNLNRKELQSLIESLQQVLINKFKNE